MVLLTLVAVGMLGLSAISIRSASQGSAQAQAQANARLALMVAIGELQKEMGPDMRISSESAMLDTKADTPEIDGVAQSRWLGSYNSWGDWLNNTYTSTEISGGSATISQTYTAGRGKMFRRWMLSLPDVATEKNLQAPVSSDHANDKDWVALVGTGSLGTSAATDRITRAYLTKIGKTGKYAWWIGGENQKARIDMAKNPRDLKTTEWEVAQGDTAEVGVGVLTGLGDLDNDENVSEKLITTQTLRPAKVDEATVKEGFFDLTANSQGVLASVRSGHLKKDLSLLFEQGKASLQPPYAFNSGDDREPSIRPMSSEIAGKAATDRHFTSWTRMRHFYRIYRTDDNDAQAPNLAGGGTSDGLPKGLDWDPGSNKPWTDSVASAGVGTSTGATWTASWTGEDTYVRFPILTNITYILNLQTTKITTGADAGKSSLKYLVTPVHVYWNPYNVELRVPSGAMGGRSSPRMVQPMKGRISSTGSPDVEIDFSIGQDTYSINSSNGSPIIFKPGQFRIFSPRRGDTTDMSPGFEPNPSFFGGIEDNNIIGAYTKASNPKIAITFSSQGVPGKLWNSQYGNTPGSFVSIPFWRAAKTSSFANFLPFNLHIDWFNKSQNFAPITSPGAPAEWNFDITEPLPVAYFQLLLKGVYQSADRPSGLGLDQDWRCRNWIQAPPFYLGKGLYMSEDVKDGNTLRIDCPYEMRFGPLGVAGAGSGFEDIIQCSGDSAIISSTRYGEKVVAAPALELPTAPISSLAGFAGMRIDPGWTSLETLNPAWQVTKAKANGNNTSGFSNSFGLSKAMAYQSGVTGPGIGNSFLHPMIPRTGVYQRFENSTSQEPLDFTSPSPAYTTTNTLAYCDYWDHVLLLNDALWDDYFVSSLADQKRPGASAINLSANLDRLVAGDDISNSRYRFYSGGKVPATVKNELADVDGYLKAAKHLMVDGMFNVNSTSVAAWQALFAGIRERKIVYRDKNGALNTVDILDGKRIAVSRFNTATCEKESTDPIYGVVRDDNLAAWSDVRFLDDSQLKKLAEECVKQVKRRGPFLNFSEFINRRLSDGDLGIMGALQSAIDYDDANPEAGSINYGFKKDPAHMLTATDLGSANAFKTPEAAYGSRFAGIPGYVIQSDLLKPIANTLTVRDDTFRIRAYGEALDASGKVTARAWCEAVVQRLPEYQDPTDAPESPARLLDAAAGTFSDGTLSATNRLFGRKFRIESFRWLSGSEI